MACARCEKPYTAGGECSVPHPIALRKDCGSMFGFGGNANFYSCGACGQSWTERFECEFGEVDGKTIRIDGDVTIKGPRWCFEGKHTLALENGDKRVLRASEVNLSEGRDPALLQQQLDTLAQDHPGCTKLTIHSTQYSEKRFKLEANLPQLKSLVIDGLKFSKLVLTDALTPLLTDLQMVNVGDVDDMDFSVEVSALQHLVIHFMTSDEGDPVHRMLAAATQLVTFQSYKLIMPGNSLVFASNSLEEVSIKRSDCLTGLTLWAPRLKALNLFSCYDIEEMEVQRAHPLRAQLPANFTPSRFVVNASNSVLSKGAVDTLLNYPRVALIVGIEGVDDEDEYEMDEEDEDEDEDDEEVEN